VREVHQNRASAFYELRVRGETLEATGDHPFWVDDGPRSGWTAARDLRSGAMVLMLDGTIAPIDDAVLVDRERQATYNLEIDGTATYFVGPGILVHNQGRDFGLGDYVIYEGRYEPDPGFERPDLVAKFKNAIYIGMTNDLPRRQGQERAMGKKGLRGAPEPEQRDFFEFMRWVKLRPRARGLEKPYAQYLEQQNIDIELKDGRYRVMNRDLRPVSKARQRLLIEQMNADPRVTDCPP
jgi:intein/homing endonuclease